MCVCVCSVHGAQGGQKNVLGLDPLELEWLGVVMSWDGD